MGDSILDWEKICKQVQIERDLWRDEARCAAEWIDKDQEDYLYLEKALNRYVLARRAREDACLI